MRYKTWFVAKLWSLGSDWFTYSEAHSVDHRDETKNVFARRFGPLFIVYWADGYVPWWSSSRGETLWQSVHGDSRARRVARSLTGYETELLDAAIKQSATPLYEIE